MSKNGKIIIIGGGASGLAAGLAAAKGGGGQCVTVLEPLDRVGKKLLATGNGRCNLTNRNAAPEHYHSADTARLADILERTPPDAVLDFFGEMGLLCDTQADGRVYPYCYQASMVLDVLRAALERAGVDVACMFLYACSSAAKAVLDFTRRPFMKKYCMARLLREAWGLDT